MGVSSDLGISGKSFPSVLTTLDVTGVLPGFESWIAFGTGGDWSVYTASHAALFLELGCLQLHVSLSSRSSFSCWLCLLEA
jgi:hypothetical protein